MGRTEPHKQYPGITSRSRNSSSGGGQNRYLKGALMDSTLLEVSTVQTHHLGAGTNAAEVDHREVLPRHCPGLTASLAANPVRNIR